ncbi:4-demethylwyosine synthase TYW1 [Candidatus Bathyarchaeota archaeon]|nr:MAG: 4-demethylwyosine synthase TYW1 [Candidatus Bathyarchaeota archaeon]
MNVPESFRKILIKQGYRLVGKHSGVKICEWTRRSLTRGEYCYKQKWYGIESHRCLQCSLALFWCLNRCLYCWRSFKLFLGAEMKVEPDDPEWILEGLIEAQRMLLVGYKGNPKVPRWKWEEAQNPTNLAISLIGESVLYQRLPEFIAVAKERGMNTFLVTKGTYPEMLAKLEVEPTNLYISLCAPDKETFESLDRPITPDGWEKQMESLELMKSFSCRKVIRITLVKGYNMHGIDDYARLIAKAEPDYIEPKAYMWVGESRKRLPGDAMPTHEDVIEFARKLAEETGYRFVDFFRPSRVALLSAK